MRFGVIADDVAASGSLSKEIRACPRVPPDHEKCRAGVMAVEKIQQPWRYRGIRAVVEGDRKFARRRGVVNRWPEQLRARIHGAVCS